MNFGLSEQVLEKLITLFGKETDVEEVILFGSRAKGTFKEGSDIDLALKGANTNLKLVRKIELEIDDRMLPYVVDLVIYNEIKEPQLTDHINRAGICIFKNINHQTHD